MTRNIKPDDGGLITRPRRIAAHMFTGPRYDPAEPDGPDNRARVVADPELGKVVGDLAAVVKRMVPKVLGTQVYVLDASGQATDQYRVPYACLSVQSESLARLVLTSSPRMGNAPGAGPGMARIPVLGYAVVNIAGHAWTIYGGSPGDLVSVTAYAQPQPPDASAAIPAATGSFASTGTVLVTSAAAGQVIATAAGTPAAPQSVPAGLYTVNWAVILKGTLAAIDDDNFGLYVGNTLIAQSINAENIGALYTQPPAQVTVPAGGAPVSVKAIALATVASVYNAALTGSGALR